MKDNECFNPKTIFQLNCQSRSNGGEIFGYYTGNSLKRFSDEVPDLLAFKLYKIEKNETINSCEVLYISFQEIVNSNYDLWLCSTELMYANYRISPQSPQFYSLLYDLIKNKTEIKINSFLIESSRESDMIADNSTDCLVYADIRVGTQYNTLPIRNFNSNNLNISKSHEFIVISVRGIWSGDIIEREIVGANFTFITHQHLIVKKDSELANDIRILCDEKMNFKICELANLLHQTTEGFVDDSIKKYL
jgi:hypothetical protein